MVSRLRNHLYRTIEILLRSRPLGVFFAFRPKRNAHHRADLAKPFLSPVTVCDRVAAGRIRLLVEGGDELGHEFRRQITLLEIVRERP